VSEQTERNGVRVGVAAFVLWGLLTIYWKQLSGLDAVELIAWRMFTAAIVMGIVTTVRGTWPAIVIAFRSRSAVINDRVIETALGYFIAPLGTMAIGVIILGERANRAQKIAFGLVTIAVVILTVGAGQPPWISLVLAATWSSYALSKRNMPLGAIDSLTGETFVLVLPAAVALIVISGRSSSAVNTALAADWVLLIGTGFITAVPLMLFASAAKAIPFTLLGPLNLIVPVINFGLGWALYNEPLPINRLIGFTFVWLALVVVMTDRIRFHHRVAQPHTAVGDEPEADSTGADLIT
jgi:chloramphenicol-sensitive protein RarD